MKESSYRQESNTFAKRQRDGKEEGVEAETRCKTLRKQWLRLTDAQFDEPEAESGRLMSQSQHARLDFTSNNTTCVVTDA
ncbi:MAG: hypothetical protein R3C02_05445 [Planctomycetaceae bacterium]